MKRFSQAWLLMLALGLGVGLGTAAWAQLWHGGSIGALIAQGVTTLLALTDVPDTLYTGNAGKALVVNSAEDAVTIADIPITAPQSAICTDSADANPGVLSLQPTSHVVLVTNEDGDGCTLTLSETTPILGPVMILVVSNLGDPVNMADVAGVQELTASYAMDAGHLLVVSYADGAWHEVTRSVFPTLEQLPSRTITTAVNESTALTISDGPSSIKLYIDATLGPTIKMLCDGSPCLIVLDPEPGNPVTIKTNNITRMQFEPDGSITVAGVRERLVWDSDSMKPDGIHCQYSDDQTVNSGPIDNFIICTENAAQQISLKKYVLPPNYSGTTLGFVLHAADVDALSQVLAFNIQAMCRSPNIDTIDNTWSTSVAIATPAMAVAHRAYKSSEVTVTPEGSCSAGDWLFVRLVANTATNTDDGNARLSFVEAFHGISELMQ